MTDFGFGSVNLTHDDFLKPGWVIQLGNPPNRIDLLTSVSGLEFEEAFAQRNVVDVMDLPIAFVSLKDLIRNKKASGRPQDIADVNHLQKEH